jgi:hypothetical protein
MEVRKAIIWYCVGGIRNPVSPRYTETQSFTLHLPAEEFHLSCLRAGMPVPPWGGNLLLYRC